MPNEDAAPDSAPKPEDVGLMRELAIGLGLLPHYRDMKGWGVGRGYLHPSRSAELIYLLISILGALTIYTCLVTSVFRDTWTAYYQGNAVASVLDEIPQLFGYRNPSQLSVHDKTDEWDERANGDIPSEKRSTVLLRVMQQLEVIDPTLSLEDAKQERSFSILEQILCKSDKRPFYVRPSLELVADVLTSLGSAVPSWYKGEDGSDTPIQFREDLERLTAAMLADYPDVTEEFSEFLSTPAGSDENDQNKALNDAWAELVAKAEREQIICQFKIENTAPPVDVILHLLYQQANIRSVPSFDALQFDVPENELSADDTAKIELFLRKLLSRLTATKEVKKSSFWMGMFRGYEQFLMLVAFIFMICLLTSRLLFRRHEANRAALVIERMRELFKTTTGRIADLATRKKIVEELLAPPDFKAINDNKLYEPSIAQLFVRIAWQQLNSTDPSEQKSLEALESTARHIRVNDASSRWLITWLSRALPALGFLGTVHGIAIALTSADSLVRATTPDTQAAAVNVVAGNLGVAFTTTLIALLMGLITSWWNDRQAYQERILVNELEREVGYLIDPVGYDELSSPLPRKRRPK